MQRPLRRREDLLQLALLLASRSQEASRQRLIRGDARIGVVLVEQRLELVRTGEVDLLHLGNLIRRQGEIGLELVRRILRDLVGVRRSWTLGHGGRRGARQRGHRAEHHPRDLLHYHRSSCPPDGTHPATSNRGRISSSYACLRSVSGSLATAGEAIGPW